MPDDDESREGPQFTQNSNTAPPGSWVGNQVGQNYGSVHSDNSSTYNYSTESPDELQRAAVNYLAADSPRPAEKILHDLMWGRPSTTERAYYYVLSILGGRSIYDIDRDLISEVRKAWKFCASKQRDPWCDALDVVMGLLRCLPYTAEEERKDQAAGDPEWDSEWMDLATLEDLPVERQEEIRQNLAQIASGLAKDRLEAGARERVLAARVGAGRLARVWKFFEQEPLGPRLYPLPPLQVATPDRRLSAGGLALLLSGGALVAVDLWWAALAALVGLLGSSWLLTAWGVEKTARQHVLDAEKHDAELYRTLPDPRSPGHWVPSELVADLCRLVDEQFAEARPHRRGTWSEQTVEVRAYLKKRLVDQYGNSQRPADAMKWLAHWYARRAAASGGPAWQPRGSTAPDAPVPATVRRQLWLGFAGTAVTLGALTAAGELLEALLMGLGEAGVVSVGRRTAARQRALALRESAERRLLAEEQKGHAEWLVALADRPTEAEMARWLAMDKAHVRYDAIERAGLADRDVVAYVVMTEGAKGAAQVRKKGRPPRYTAYLVRVFLLSYSGVREATARLDFLTGDISNETRNLFRYEALASASVRENGVRRVRDVKGTPMRSGRQRTVSFTLRLLNGEEIVSVREPSHDLDGDLDGQDEDLADLVLRNSGLEGALRILESVASEGADWIRRDLERRERWTHDLFE